MLTARDNPEDKIMGLDSGSDDYVVKPFDPREVSARVRALLRRSAELTGQREHEGEKMVAELPGLKVDMSRYVVDKNGLAIEMKPKEIQLLYFLVVNSDRVFSREALLDKVWGYDYAGGTRTVDVHIKRIREKIEGKNDSWRIKTIWGVGYKLEAGDEERHL
jgi:DNA-binding response OmpR family regulator